MWALTLLAVLQAARANPCIRISYGTDENGAKTVSKSFAITARSPEACKKNQFSGLGPTKGYALEVSILKVLNEKRNASSYTTRKCRDRYFPKLLARRDPQRALSRDYVSRGVDTNYWCLASPQRPDVRTGRALRKMRDLSNAQGARRAPGFVRRGDGREKYRASRRQTNVDRGAEIKFEFERCAE